MRDEIEKALRRDFEALYDKVMGLLSRLENSETDAELRALARAGRAQIAEEFHP